MNKQVYNPNSTEDFMEAKVVGGNPPGIINYERTPHKWAYHIYKLFLSNTWFPSEVDTGKDKLHYSNLTDADKRMYDLVLAQLISNDSIQTNQLIDSINKFITSPVVNAAIARQSYEESSHSLSYSVMAEDISGETDRIFNMFREDEGLAKKNKAVADMFALVNQDIKTVTNEDLLCAFAANQILEEMVFPVGFVCMYALQATMQGTAKMIQFIQRDETAHVLLFKNIYGTALRELNIAPPESRVVNMVKIMADAEKEWGYYCTKGVMGFSKQAIDNLVEAQANSVCKNLKIPPVYKEVPLTSNPLLQVLIDNDITKTSSKANPLEKTVSDYALGKLVMDDF